MSVTTIKQAVLSERLFLLKELDFTYDKPYTFSRSVQTELRILDTVASVLTSGRGDTYAAALDKNNGFVQVILAKSPGEPTIEDKAFAKEFFALIVNPTTSDATDVFPFVLKHRRDYLNQRIKKLHAISTDDSFKEYFHIALRRYVADLGDTSFEVQFPRGHSRLDPNQAYDCLLKECLLQTQSLSADDLNVSFSDAYNTFSNLSIVSEILASSAFMQEFKRYNRVLNAGWKFGKFIRHAEKISRYIRGIKCLLKHAKRLFPLGPAIPHRWVENTFTGTGEGEVQFRTKNPYEVVCFIRREDTLPEKHSDNLNKVYPSNREPWQHLSAFLHPEMRIVLSSLDLEKGCGRTTRTIGLSKQPCLACLLWLQHCSKDTPTRWVTNGACAKADPTFTLSGKSYLGATPGRNQYLADNWVETFVYMRLVEELHRVLKRGY